MKNTNILIVDDHTMFTEGISSLLDGVDGIHITGTANSGNSAIQFLEKNTSVNLVLTDISMDDMDGIELAQKLNKSHPNLPIIGLSMHKEESIIKKFLKVGAKGYLLKDTDKAELLQAINSVLEGKTFVSDKVQNILMNNLFTDGAESKTTTIVPELSEREQDVLRLIAEEHTMQEIGEKLFISHHTAVYHRRNLFEKFDVKTSTGLVRKAVEMGLV